MLVASGLYELAWWGAVGDGSYMRSSTLVAGTGALGVGLAVGSLVASGRSNGRARAQASADARSCWRPVDSGALHVSTHGFYLTDGQYGHRHFAWSHIVQTDVPEYGFVQFAADTTAGPQKYRLRSDWAELVFAYWALARHRSHPQWIDRSWFPFEVMRQRAAYHGRLMPQLPATGP